MSPFLLVRMPLQSIKNAIILLSMTTLISLLPLVHAQSDTCTSESTLTRETYNSAVLGQTMFYTVYTPPCYDENTTYPVMYLMHGSNEDDGHWQRLGFPERLDQRILNNEMSPVILVMPFGNVIANRNNFDTLSWNNIFLTELLPDVESKYSISQNRDQRAIGGISRGGFWAYQIAFSNPDLFSVVGGHSAFFDEFHAEAEYNPLDLALSEPAIDSMSLWLDRGADDFAAPGLDLMDERLTASGVSYTYEIYPEGEHNNIYWSSHIEIYLDFYVQITETPEPPAQPTPQSPSGFVTNTPSVPIEVTSTPISTPTLTPVPDTGDTLYVPAVAFPSTLTSVSSADLQAIANGTFDERLVISSSVAEQLPAHPDTRIVPDDTLRDNLWQNRERFTLLPLNGLNMQYRILFVDDQPITQVANYPFGTDTSRLTRFTFSGVTAITRNTREAINNNGVIWATEAIQPYVTQTDAFHMSNEVSFIEGCPNVSVTVFGGTNSFCSLPAHFGIFTQLEVDVVELTGNHNNDYGYEVYLDTLDLFEQNSIDTVGGGETLTQARAPYILTHNGNTVGLVACNAVGPYYAIVNDNDESLLGGIRPGAAACDWEWLEQTLPELASLVDVVVVSVQYTEVEDYLPTSEQQRDFRRLANLGADVVLGSQAHKPQTFEFYGTSRGETAFLHYGLGNFYFDQPFWGNMRFFLDTLYIYEGELRAIELFPGIIDDLARPRLMTEEERFNFLFFMFVEQNGF